MTRLRHLSVLSLLAATLLFTHASPAFSALQKGQPAPPLKVMTTSGQKVTLANYKGYVLVMDFFATWCHPCQKSVPYLTALYRKYGKQGLQVLGLSLDDTEKPVRDFIVDKKVNYPVAVVGEEFQEEYGIRSIPTMYVINKKGIVVETFRGYSDEAEKSMESLIIKLLAE